MMSLKLSHDQLKWFALHFLLSWTLHQLSHSPLFNTQNPLVTSRKTQPALQIFILIITGTKADTEHYCICNTHNWGLLKWYCSAGVQQGYSCELPRTGILGQPHGLFARAGASPAPRQSPEWPDPQQRYLHAVVTDAAVGAAGRAVEVAGGAPLHPYLDSFDLHVLVQRRAEVVVFILVFVCCSTQNWKLVETAEGKEKRANPVSTWDTGAPQRADGLSPLPCLRQESI